jgi:CheY-like chemotaxis protein/anti-sigma regulatory factor (Ser/Thr protein kinase)
VLLQRIVMNLAQNALRYTDRGTVLIACRPDSAGRGVRIEVWDSGIGIAPEHQQDVFKEFYQVNVGSALRERAFGLGLGLNIVQRTARLLGGRVSLRSAVGCGTRFSVVLPQRIPAPSEPMLPTAPMAGSVTDLVGVSVLIMEDDNAARLAVCELLQSWKCVVVAAGSADAARDLVRDGLVPDVIVSDYQLGAGDDGLQAIASLRALVGRDVPACLMSGSTAPALQAAAKNAGLTLLHKPVRPAKLRSLLRRLAASGAPSEPADSLRSALSFLPNRGTPVVLRSPRPGCDFAHQNSAEARLHGFLQFLQKRTACRQFPCWKGRRAGIAAQVPGAVSEAVWSSAEHWLTCRARMSIPAAGRRRPALLGVLPAATHHLSLIW